MGREGNAVMIRETQRKRYIINSQAIARKAIKDGFLERKEECEVCGKIGKTHAHHWNGYQNPLDVWFVCPACNRLLPHNGMSLELARLYKQGNRQIIERYPNLDAEQIKKLIEFRRALYLATLFVGDPDVLRDEMEDVVSFVNSMGDRAAHSLRDSINKITHRKTFQGGTFST